MTCPACSAQEAQFAKKRAENVLANATKTQRALFQSRAKEAGVSVSDWVYERILEAVRVCGLDAAGTLFTGEASARDFVLSLTPGQ